MNFFEQNLAIMRPRDPELAALMESDIDCSHIEVIPSQQSGVLTARVTLPSGDTVLLHNMEDPIGSAKRSAEKQEMKAGDATILLGLGLGYLARELAARLENKHPLLICELDPAILKTALIHVDLKAVLDSDFIKILTGGEIPLPEWIQRLAGRFMTARVEAISYEPSFRTNREAYDRLREISQKESRAIILNKNTTVKAGQVLMVNLLENFPEVLQTAGVKHLQDIFKGRPAILVAAGPSLEKNVHLLREVEGRAVIIAVDTALRLLLPLDIKPDIVTTIDFNRQNYQKFENVPVDPDVSLVYHPGGYHKSVTAFNGPKFTYSKVPTRVHAWLMEYVEDKGQMPPGTTVAHLSFFLARYLGCDPIVMIGQDLAFPKNQIHAGDLSLWRINTDEMDTIEDIFGEPVGSMTSFKHAIYHFEKAFKETKAMVIDATEAGAKKQGAHVMRLRDVIDECCQIPPLDIKKTLRDASEQVEPARMDELLRELDYVSAELGTIQSDCGQIMQVVRKLDKKIHKGEMDDDGFVKLSCAAEKLTQEMEHRGRVLALMAEQKFSLELYMQTHAISAMDEIEDIDEKIKQQVSRAKIYYPELSRTAEFFKRALDRMIGRLRRAGQLSFEPLGTEATAEQWYQRALALRKIEYPRDAIAAVQRAVALDYNHIQALQLLCRLFLESQRLEEALDTVKRLRSLRPSDRKVAALSREVSAKHEAWTQRCDLLKSEFLRKRPADTLEEAGWFYYRAKDYPRAIEKLERAASATPSAGVYCRLGQAKAKSGDLDGAMQAFERGIALDPTSAELYKELGRLALEQGHKQQAELFFREAVRIEPDDAMSWESLGRLYSDRGGYAEAGLCYEQVLRLDPDRRELIPQIAALYQHQIGLAVNTQ